MLIVGDQAVHSRYTQGDKIDGQFIGGGIAGAIAGGIGVGGGDREHTGGQDFASGGQIQCPSAAGIGGQRRIATEVVRLAIDRDLQLGAAGEGAGDGGLLIVGDQAIHARHGGCSHINSQLSTGGIAAAVAGDVGGGGADVINAFAHGLARRAEIELPGAGARFGQGGVSAQDVGAAVDADAEFVAAGKSTHDRGLLHVGDQRGHRWHCWWRAVDGQFIAGGVGGGIAGGVGGGGVDVVHAVAERVASGGQLSCQVPGLGSLRAPSVPRT